MVLQYGSNFGNCQRLFLFLSACRFIFHSSVKFSCIYRQSYGSSGYGLQHNISLADHML